MLLSFKLGDSAEVKRLWDEYSCWGKILLLQQWLTDSWVKWESLLSNRWSLKLLKLLLLVKTIICFSCWRFSSLFEKPLWEPARRISLSISLAYSLGLSLGLTLDLEDPNPYHCTRICRRSWCTRLVLLRITSLKLGARKHSRTLCTCLLAR